MNHRRRRHHWHTDRLGSLVSAGLATVRRAEPSDSVWRAIEESLEQAEPKSGSASGMGGMLWRVTSALSWHTGRGLPPLVVLPGAAVLGVIIMFAVAMEGVDAPPWQHSAPAPSAAGHTSFGLSEPEFALQPEMDGRLVGVAMPSGPTAREAPPPPPIRPVQLRPALRAAADSQELALTSQ